MTSSVLARTKELQMLDERFDRVLEDYDDEEIGELEQDDPRFSFFFFKKKTNKHQILKQKFLSFRLVSKEI